MSTRLANPELEAWLDSHMVRNLAGRHLADGDLLFVASIMGRDTAHDGTVALRLRGSGELRWAKTLEEPKRAGQDPQMPSPWPRENKDDRNRIVPTPDGGALVVGRRDQGYSPAVVKLDESGNVAWRAVADLGFERDFEHVPTWVVDADIGTAAKAHCLHGRQPCVRACQRSAGGLHRRHPDKYEAAVKKYGPDGHLL
jgi:hypothetical protein